jgi:hypothetical protein
MASGSGFGYVGPQGMLATVFDNPGGERVQTAQQFRDEMSAAMTLGAQARGGDTHVMVHAQTNADPHQISREVAWALRTGGRY